MHYSQSQIRVDQGETITFVVTNKGKLMHELVLGTEDELKKHAEVMRKYPGMEHDEPYMAHVKPAARTDHLEIHEARHVPLRLSRRRPFRGGHEGHDRGRGQIGEPDVSLPAASGASSDDMLFVVIATLVASAARRLPQHERGSRRAIVIATAIGAMVDGEVRKVDRRQKDHDQAWRAQEPRHAGDDDGVPGQGSAMLDKVKAGDKVKFRADKVSGAYTVVEIEPPAELTSMRPLLLLSSNLVIAQHV